MVKFENIFSTGWDHIQQVLLVSLGFRKLIGLFQLVLTHLGSESCTVCNSALLMLLIGELFSLIILWML